MHKIKIKLLLNKICTKKIGMGHIDKDYLNAKFKHSLEVYKIARKIDKKLAVKYSAAFLFHDIGRFYGTDSKDFNHADFGYRLLKKSGWFNNFIILPILYHESDLNWKELINKHCKSEKMSTEDIEIISDLCALLKDADLIANMRGICKEKIIQQTHNIKISYTNFNNFMNNKICIAQPKSKQQFNKITYILCGLSIINLPKSKIFLKNERIVADLIAKLRLLSPEYDNKLNLAINKMKSKAIIDGWIDANNIIVLKKRWKHNNIPNRFTEIGIDPDNNKLLFGISSEIEDMPANYEVRKKGFIKMHAKEFFIRVWILKYSISIGTGEIEIVNKNRNNFKILFGIAGTK